MKIKIAVLLLLSSAAFGMEQKAFDPPPPVQQQLQLNLSDRCQYKLNRYEAKVDLYKNENGATEAYYRYLLRKWQRRCLTQ